MVAYNYMSNRFVPIITVLVFSLISILLIFFGSTEETGFSITLTESAISSTTDSDGDGTPDWLEEISDSNPKNASSFPYERNIALAKNITVDDLIYGGPGEFTEEITRRILSGKSETISNAEKEEFISTSVEYFKNQLEEKRLPSIQLSVDNEVSKDDLVQKYTNAIELFGRTEIPIDIIVFQTFSENDAYFSIARQKRGECLQTLKIIPRNVPSNVYAEYYAVLERITYLCTALDIAFTARTPENFFFIFKLLQSGEILNEHSVPDGSDSGAIFASFIMKIIDTLSQKT